MKTMIVRDTYDVVIIFVALVSVTFFCWMTGKYDEPSIKKIEKIKPNAVFTVSGDSIIGIDGYIDAGDSNRLDSTYIRTSNHVHDINK